jgi:integrase
VLTADEVRAVLARLEGTHSLVAGLLYGSGLRLLECLRLRVKDLDFAVREVMVRDGKGRRDRVTPLPEALVPRLREHLGRVKALHDADLAAGLRGRRAPDGSGAQVSERGVRMGMAVGLPSASALRRSADRHGAPPSSTTMIYTHVLRLGGRGVRSPLDDVL